MSQAATSEGTEGAPSNATAPPQSLDPYWMGVLAHLFNYDELHIRQKLLAIAQKYYVEDAWGQRRFFVVRPPKLTIHILLGVFISVIRFMILIGVFQFLMKGGSILVCAVLLIGGNLALGIAHVLLAPYRHIEVFSDESQSWRLLLITQDNKLAFWKRYTLFDTLGNEVARLRRDTLRSIWRREWIVESPTGEYLFSVREDSLWLALLRRYLGPLYGALRTNFNFEHGDGSVFGKYDRKLTITDQYVLDLRGDPNRLVDRRATLAMAILLDTAESR